MVGIEHFRALTTKTDLENRRVTVDQDLQEIRAPNSLKGRIINWIKGTHVGDERAQENKEARLAFYNALVKAEGSKEFAEAVIKRVFGMDGEQFVARETNLQASKIKKALDVAGRFRREFRMENERALDQYVKNGNLGSVVQTMARGKFSTLGHPELKRNDPDVTREFRKLVRLDPDYRHRTFTREELDTIAEKAVERACAIKRARFEEQYPELSKIDTPHFHDSETFFTAMRGGHEDQWTGFALESLEESTKVLGKMSFDPDRVRDLRFETVTLRDNLQHLRDTSPVQRLGQAQRDLALRTVEETIQNLPVDQKLKHQLNLHAQQSINTFLSTLGEDESIEDESVRARLVNAVSEALDQDLVALLAPDELRDKLNVANGNYRKIAQSKEENRTEQLGILRGEIEDIGKQIVESSQDQRNLAITEFRNTFTARLLDDPELQELPKYMTEDKAQYRLERECDNQIAKLNAKIAYFNRYLDNDPRSEKSITHDKLIWAKATVNELQRIEGHLTEQRDKLRALNTQRLNGDLLTDRQLAQLDGYDDKMTAIGDGLEHIAQKIRSARTRVEDLEQELTRSPSNNDGDERIVFGDENIEVVQDQRPLHVRLTENRTEETEFLKSCLDDIQVIPKGRIGGMLDEARGRVLANPSSVVPIQRDMVVTRDGVTRTYRSEIVPNGGGDLLDTEQMLLVGWMRENGLPESHARVPNLQVSQIKQVVSQTNDDDEVTEKEVLKSQIIRHGVLDSWDIENSEHREYVAGARARQVAIVGANLAPREFLLEARRRSNEGEQLNKLVHVNIGLSTSDPSGRHLDRRDGEFIQHQIGAFGTLNGQQSLPIRFHDEENPLPDYSDSDDNIGILKVTSQDTDVSFDVDTITFGFSVSRNGTGSTRFDEHDRLNLIKLVGDLAVGTAPGGYIGGVVDALQAKRDDPETSELQRQEIDDLLGKIRREVDTARELFTTGLYKDLSVDPYKMARTIMRVVDLAGEGARLSGDNSMHMSLSEGCRTNLGGGSKLDIEHKSQVIIEDMGGRMRPMQLDMSNQHDDQDRIIYNTVLTSSGDTELQGQQTGLLGMDTRDISSRSRDIEALTYTTGFTDPRRR